MVAVVAPARQQDATGALRHRGRDRLALVRQRVVEPAREALPGARARGHEVSACQLAQASALGVERVAGIIAPDHRHRVGRRFLPSSLPSGWLELGVLPAPASASAVSPARR